jgi:hypothetical protein
MFHENHLGLAGRAGASGEAGRRAAGRFSFVLEPEGLDPRWERLCRPFRRSPKVLLDACLAAFAEAGGCRLLTLKRAFGQFPELDHELVAG